MASKLNVVLFLLLFSVVKTQEQSDNKIKDISSYPKDFFLNFVERSAIYGFESQEHTVTTEDGYILKIFRMKKKDCVKYNKTPVLLLHGLIQTSNHWLDSGPNASLAYLIAGECHDLWLGNDRGNYNSRAHVYLNPDKDSKFWDYSLDEIGLYDVPAVIDYVLKYTEEDKVNFIGYSQGGTTFLIMCSERPEYCDNNVNVFLGLAPAVKITNMKTAVVKTAIETIYNLRGILQAIGIREVLGKGGMTYDLLGLMCKLRPISKIVCESGAAMLDSSHPGSVKSETWQILSKHTPAGTSLRNLIHYTQIFKMDKFQKFDFGKLRNLETYGTEKPPTYNLTTVTVPVVLFHGIKDYFIDNKDMLWLKEQLPNVIESYEITDPLWNHIDMAYSQNIKTMLFPKVNEYLLKYNKQEE